MSIIISIVPIVLGALAASSAATKAITLIETDADNKKNNQDVTEFSTSIRNENLLRETLIKMGARNIQADQKSLGSDIDHFHIAFAQKNDQTFSIRFVGNVKQEEAICFKDDLIAEYSHTAQSHVYETLKRRAEEKGLRLEKEVLQSDQSIVLTYNVN